MSTKENKNDMVNFSYVAQEKTDRIKSILFNLVEKQKNFYRLNTIAANECSKRCLNNFKTDKLNSQETMCLTVCTENFYNMLDLGEIVYDRLNNKEVDSTPMLKGDFETVINNI